MIKLHFNEQFLRLLGPIISRFFACSNEEKKSTKTTKCVCSSLISMIECHKHALFAKCYYTDCHYAECPTFVSRDLKSKKSSQKDEVNLLRKVL